MPEEVGQGVVEVETLRRYGRVPVGTRAVFPIVLVKEDATHYHAQCTIRVGEDPRETTFICLISGITGGSEETIRLSRYVRGVLKPFEGNLAAYALSQVVDALEEMNTRSGHQRFRVVRAEWNDG
jgi:hypothetical protein